MSEGGQWEWKNKGIGRPERRWLGRVKGDIKNDCREARERPSYTEA